MNTFSKEEKKGAPLSTLLLLASNTGLAAYLLLNKLELWIFIIITTFNLFNIFKIKNILTTPDQTRSKLTNKIEEHLQISIRVMK